MIALLIYTAFVFVSGLAIGATLFSDWLDWLSRRPKPPSTKLPLAVVLTRAESKQLEIPAIKRRQPIARTVLGWERQP